MALYNFNYGVGIAATGNATITCTVGGRSWGTVSVVKWPVAGVYDGSASTAVMTCEAGSTHIGCALMSDVPIGMDTIPAGTLSLAVKISTGSGSSKSTLEEIYVCEVSSDGATNYGTIGSATSLGYSLKDAGAMLGNITLGSPYSVSDPTHHYAAFFVVSNSDSKNNLSVTLERSSGAAYSPIRWPYETPNGDEFALGHYRWRQDISTSETLYWLADEDTALDPFTPGTEYRLRLLVRSTKPEYLTANQYLYLQYRINAGSWAAIGTTDSSAVWSHNSTYVTDATDTTAQLTAANGPFLADNGGWQEVSTYWNSSDGDYIYAGYYTELEWTVQPSDAYGSWGDDDVVQFRLCLGSSGTNPITSTVTPQATISLGAAGVTVNCTADAVTVGSYAASVIYPTIISAAAAAITVSGYAADISADTFIQTTVGAVTTTPYAADVEAKAEIAATLGAVTVAPKNATVPQATIVSATSDAVTATPYASTIAANRDISATLSSVTVAPLAGAVNAETAFPATAGAVTAAAYAATISADVYATATLGSVTAASYAADVALKRTVWATTAAITANSYAAEVAAHTKVHATVAAVTAAAYQSTIQTAATVAATLGQVTVAGYATDISSNVGVDVSVSAVTAAPLQPTVNAARLVEATTSGITVASYASDVSAHTKVNATSPAVTVATYSAAVAAGNAIAASAGSVSVNPYAASISADRVVSVGTTGSITAGALQPTVLVGVSAYPATGSVTVAGQDAAVITGAFVSATSGSINVSGYNPRVNRLFDERFEGTGYEETWAETIDGTATLNEDASTALVGSPSGWGDQCLEVVVGSGENCYIEHDFSPDPQRTFYARAEFCLTAEGMSNGQGAQILRIWSGNTILSVQIRQANGLLFLRFNCMYDGSDHLVEVYDLELNKIYRVELKWDLEAEEFAYWLNGHLIDSGTISGTPLTWGCRYLRAGRLSASFTSTLYFDRIAIDSNALPGVESDGIRFIGAGLEAVTATSYDATVEALAQVDATKAAITVTGYNPTVSAARVVSSSTGAVTVAGLPASLAVDMVVSATKGAITATGNQAAIAGFTYFVCQGGTAGTKDQADGESGLSSYMSVTTHNSQIYAPGDTIVISDYNGIIRVNDDAILKPQSHGEQGARITYLGSGSPILSAADLITDSWTEESGIGADIWSVSRTAVPLQVFFDDTRGMEVAGTSSLAQEFDWYYDSGGEKLYVWCDNASGPAAEYTGRGVEVTDGDSATNCVNYSDGDRNWIVWDGIQFEKAAEYSFNIYGADLSGLDVRNCTFRNSYAAGARINGGSTGLTNVLVEDNVAEYNGGHGIVFSGKQDGTLARRLRASYNGHYEDQTEEGYHEFTGGLKLVGPNNDNFVLEDSVGEYQNTTWPVGTRGSGGNGIWTDVQFSGGVIKRSIGRFNNDEGIRIESTTYTTAYACLAYGNGGLGLHIAGNAVTLNPANYNKLYNCVAYGNNSGIEVSANFADGCIGNEVKNCISSGNTYRELRAHLGGENDGTNGYLNRYVNNCFGAQATGFIRVDGSNYNTYYDAIDALNAVDGSTYTDNPALQVDPQFADQGSYKFYLLSTSPCIDEGVDLGDSYDDALDPRCLPVAWPSNVASLDQDDWGSGWEVGAYVHDAVGKAAVTLTGKNASVIEGTGVWVSATTAAITATGFSPGISAHTSLVATKPAVTVTSYAAAISADTAFTATVGSITATALAAAVEAKATVTTNAGAVTVAALDASLEFAKTVEATSGAVTVAAYNPTVYVATAVYPATGSITVAPRNAAVSAGGVIAATTGQVTVAKLDAAIAADLVIDLTADAVVVAGRGATINVGQLVECSSDAVTVTAYGADVAAGSAIQATRPAITVAALPCSIAAASNIQATADAVVVAPFGSSVSVDRTIPITLGAVTATASDAGISADQFIAAVAANVAVAALQPSLLVGQTVYPTKASVTATGYDTQSNANVRVTATLDAVAINALAAAVEAKTTIATVRGTVTVTGINPSVLADVYITVDLGAVTTAPQDALVNAGTKANPNVGAVAVTAIDPLVYVPLAVYPNVGTITATGRNCGVFGGILHVALASITVAAPQPTIRRAFSFLVDPSISSITIQRGMTSTSIRYDIDSNSIDYQIEELA